MAIKISGSSFKNNGTGISIPEDVDLEMDTTEMIDNGIGIEVRKNIHSLFKDFEKVITQSKLDNASKERLLKEVLDVIKSGKVSQNKEKEIMTKLRFLGNEAIAIVKDIFVRVASSVIVSKLGA